MQSSKDNAQLKQLLDDKERLWHELKTKHKEVYAWLMAKNIQFEDLAKYARSLSVAVILVSTTIATPVTNLDKGEILSVATQKQVIATEELIHIDEEARAKLVWERYGQYIQKSAEKHRVDQKIIFATIMTESNGNTFSKRNEPQINDASYGLGQILYGTARGIGFEGKPDDLYNPEKNIDLVGKYYRYNLDHYGDLTINQLVTSYNAGNPYAQAYPGHITKFNRWYNKIKAIV